MVVHPISDVPVTAFLVLGLVLALRLAMARVLDGRSRVDGDLHPAKSRCSSGRCLLAFIVLSAKPAAGESPVRARVRAFLWFSIGGAPLVLAVATLNTVLYGSPWSAGHGSLDEL